MFQTCSELTSIYVTAGFACKVRLPTDKTYARVDGGTDSPGYFTVKE